MKPVCSIPGCSKPTVGRGWCRAHYTRWDRTGDPLGSKARDEAEIEAWIKMACAWTSEACLLWPFSFSNTSGYGTYQWWDGQKSHGTSAHREVCKRAHGSPPTPKHHAAHDPIRCTSKLCCNPAHVRWATPKENEADKTIAGTSGRRLRNRSGRYLANPKDVEAHEGGG